MPRTFYGLSALVGTTQWLASQETAPAEADTSPSTNWQVAASGGATATSGETANMNSQAQVTAATFNVADRPTALDAAIGNAFMTPAALKGFTPEGNWIMSLIVRPGNNTYGNIRFRMRVFKSAFADGSSPTMLTPTTLITNTAGLTGANTFVQFTVTWAAPRVDLNTEYLLWAIALESQSSIGNSNSKSAAMGVGPRLYMQIPDIMPFTFEQVGAIGI